MMINDAPLDISFYDQNQSFNAKENRNIVLPQEANRVMKLNAKSPNLPSLIDHSNGNPSTLQFTSLSKIDTAHTPDIEFKQTANFFFPVFDQQINENAKENIPDKVQKGRGVSVFATPSENEFNLDYQQSLIQGIENDSQKKKTNKSRILINSQMNEQQDKQQLPKMLKRSHISMSQPKLHQQGGQAHIAAEKESWSNTNNPEIYKEVTHQISRNESSKKLLQENKDKRQIPNRQHIQLGGQKEQNSLINLSNSVQKYPNSNNNNNLNSNNQNKELIQQQDLRLNNFLQLFNEKQTSSVKNSNLQLINIQPKSTSNVISSSKIIPFGKQGLFQSNKEQNSLKPNLKLLDELIVGESNQPIKDITPQSCQSKIGQDFSDKIKQGGLNQILPYQIQSKHKVNFNSNQMQASTIQINQGLQEKEKSPFPLGYSHLSSQQSQSQFSQQQQQQQNKLDNIQTSNQQLINTQLGMNKQQIQSIKQKGRKGSAACLDEIQKNLHDDGFMQSLKKQQIHLLKIRQQQLKNFEGLYAPPNEMNPLDNINNKGSLPMRSDIKGQLLYSSQQDSRRNYSNNNKSPLNLQFANNLNDIRAAQAVSTDNKKLNAPESASDDNHCRSNFNLVNSLKKGKLLYQNQFDDFYGNTPNIQLGQKYNSNLHSSHISNEDESDDNIKIDGDIKRLRNKNLIHRRSIATIHTAYQVPASKLNTISKEQQQTEEQVMSEMEKVRRQIKQTINKGIRNDSKNISQALPQLNNINNGYSLQPAQQKRMDAVNNNNFTVPKKSYQFLNMVNPDLLSKVQVMHNVDDITPTGREQNGTDTNFSQVSKNNQGRTFLQRKPQENIVNKIFQNQNEIILE